MKTGLGMHYASLEDAGFTAQYSARCYCGAVEYQVGADPVDAKYCHCVMCQRLHGAPMQWAAIFHKKDVRIVSGLDVLKFFNSECLKFERILPCKVSCGHCGTLIADEGRQMWLAFPSLFDFRPTSAIPHAFKPTCHIFYSQKCINIKDELPKWSGHKNHSQRLE